MRSIISPIRPVRSPTRSMRSATGVVSPLTLPSHCEMELAFA